MPEVKNQESIIRFFMPEVKNQTTNLSKANINKL
jgi:hypothetical protein